MSTLSVLVKNRVIDKYIHGAKLFVEGRKGSEYDIQIYNNSSIRRKAVISVDGLNVVSGDTDWQRGYVVEPWQTIVIPGWRKNSGEVAKFVFSYGKHDTYNAHNDKGDSRNQGVIGCKLFDEVPQMNYNWPNYWNTTLTGYPQAAPDSFCGTLQNSGYSGPIGGNINQSSWSAAACASVPKAESSINIKAKIGTDWGKTTTFNTTSVELNFNPTASEILLIYYDTRNGLKRRGINLYNYPPTPRRQFEPNAFPSDGCPAPKYS